VCITRGSSTILTSVSFIPDTQASERGHLQQQDRKALDLLLADSMSYIDYDGSLMDKAQFLASASKRSFHPVQITDETIKAHMYGQSAVVTGLYPEMGTDKTNLTSVEGDSRTCGSG
jgi:hypothetical protein